MSFLGNELPPTPAGAFSEVWKRKMDERRITKKSVIFIVYERLKVLGGLHRRLANLCSCLVRVIWWIGHYGPQGTIHEITPTNTNEAQGWAMQKTDDRWRRNQTSTAENHRSQATQLLQN